MSSVQNNLRQSCCRARPQSQDFLEELQGPPSRTYLTRVTGPDPLHQSPPIEAGKLALAENFVEEHQELLLTFFIMSFFALREDWRKLYLTLFENHSHFMAHGKGDLGSESGRNQVKIGSESGLGGVVRRLLGREGQVQLEALCTHGGKRPSNKGLLKGLWPEENSGKIPGKFMKLLSGPS